MKKHSLEILVPGICAAAALVLALSAGAQVSASDPQAESAQAAPMKGRHHPVAGAEHDVDMKAECQAMMAKKQKVQAERAAMDAKLDELVAQMNAAATATESDAMEKMAAVVTELVAQRKTSQAMMMEMQPEMMAHMMHHRDMHGTKDGMDCPMMTKMDKSSEEPMATETSTE
jgi:Skp family chaperone for outer membrane proteins